MMQKKTTIEKSVPVSWRTTLFLIMLAGIFTLGLTFASVELPRVVDYFLGEQIDFLDAATGLNGENDLKTELYLDYYHLRLIGYICLALIVALIIMGYITSRSALSATGAIFLFLPVFGHFALTMFFLGGLGFFRLLWLPFLDVSFDLLRLGDIVLVPYRLLVSLFDFLDLPISRQLPYLITGLGLFIFMLGSLAWFYSKIKQKSIADFWIYKFSRHPQYLGWILWSYGIMCLPTNNMKRSFEISNSLPWLLTTMIIIGVAMIEEIKMKKVSGETYREYCRKTPFLFPLPKPAGRLLSAPFRLFKKGGGERKREVIAGLVFYTVLAVFLSALYGGMLGEPKENRRLLSSKEISEVVRGIRDAKSRLDVRAGLKKLVSVGDPAVNSLLGLLKDEDPIKRWYTIEALGRIKSDRVTDPLIRMLKDPERQVRRAAAYTLGRIGSREAVVPLISAFKDVDRKISTAAARGLSAIGDKKAVPVLAEALLSGSVRKAEVAAEALGNMGAKESLPHLIRCLEERMDCPYYQVGAALLKLGSDRAIDALIKGKSDQRWYVRTEVIKILGKIKTRKALMEIIGCLKDPNPRVRRRAVLTLGKSQSKLAFNALQNSLEDEDFEVRMYALDAIKKKEKK